MTCPFCQHFIPLPPAGERAKCVGCMREFRLWQDLGFFDYTVEVYIPVEDDDD